MRIRLAMAIVAIGMASGRVAHAETANFQFGYSL